MTEERTVLSDPLVNRLLGNMPEHEWASLEPHCQVKTMKYAEVVFSDDEPSDIAVFPLSAIVSMIAVMKNGDEIEYGSIGREGMLGLQVALDAQPLRGRALCQLEGEVVTIPGAELRKLDRTSALQRLLMRYAQSTINVLSQSAACNALHSIRQRTARWLLISRDRAGSDNFPLTQEFLAKMLGVQRPGVSSAAADLKRDGIIDYKRAHIHILDAQRLYEASCECYEQIRDEYARVFESVLVSPST